MPPLRLGSRGRLRHAHDWAWICAERPEARLTGVVNLVPFPGQPLPLPSPLQRFRLCGPAAHSCKFMPVAAPRQRDSLKWLWSVVRLQGLHNLYGLRWVYCPMLCRSLLHRPMLHSSHALPGGRPLDKCTTLCPCPPGPCPAAAGRCRRGSSCSRAGWRLSRIQLPSASRSCNGRRR